jgi:hypothetical protein
MTKSPDAAEFFLLWSDACAQRHDVLYRDWPKARVFTSRILSDTDSVIEMLRLRLDLECFCGYYSIDAILFDKGDLVPRSPAGTTWVRRIRIAFEHENHFNSGLFREISHLLITNCDLRVLVSYPDTHEQLASQLEYLGSIIAGTDFAASIAESASFLFIAGWRDVEKSAVTWSGHVYDITTWRTLPARCA